MERQFSKTRYFSSDGFMATDSEMVKFDYFLSVMLVLSSYKILQMATVLKISEGGLAKHITSIQRKLRKSNFMTF